ncbi:MAG TPA: cyclic nucleotide-binding domain-containing protein [Streptosporangiaceae bacterium]|nr:cyclic nucleotide-binding domain-containing protein [Streptosporangiaceae bacterium]
MSEPLLEHPFVAGLPHAAELAGRARRTEFPPGARLFEEGDEADRFWLIQTGKVALDLHVPGREDVVIETLGDGEVLGWSWLFPPYRWHFGARAVADTHAVEFDGQAVRAVCDADPTLGYALTRRFLGVMLDRLQSTRIRLLDLYAADQIGGIPS